MYNIKQLRESRGWTQEILAEISGVNRVLIANYESKGKGMTLTTAMKLAEALNCTIDDLFGKEETA
jgi:transcriptional regulator with XRE-family HTH domain